VDWDVVTKRPIPVAECEKSYYYDFCTNLTPTIFITNAVFQNIKENELDDLANKLFRKTDKLKEEIFDAYIDGRIEKDSKYLRLTKENPDNWSVKNNFRDSVFKLAKPLYYKQNNELLIDCDWTPSTKEKYFKFLKILKSKREDLEISSTLRLWQYRDYQLAGVPPVKKWLLMCYNITDPRKYETENSIATTDEFKKYINHSEYPLKLDIALPIHTWAVYFRKDVYKGIVHSIPVDEIKKNKALFEQKDEHRYMFLKDTVIEETYYRYGDEFRIEQVDFKTIKAFALLLKQYVKTDKNTRISFFSWDPQFYNRFTKDEYNQIIHIFAE